MPLLATLVLAASGVTLPHCSWDRPGVNPFTGDVVSAVDDYKDIPEATRSKLKQRMGDRSYDELVTITRDRIEGKGSYDSEIRGMHYGARGNVCTTVTRSKWTPQQSERGLVYCEDNQCILVPTVCRNVSRIKRLAAPKSALGGHTGNIASAKTEGEDSPLMIDPPAAGVIGGGTPAERPSFEQLATPQPQNPVTPGTPTNTNTPFPTPPVTPNIIPVVPEPASWMMFLAGLGAVAVKLRRRRD